MKIVFLDEYSVGGVDLSTIRSLGDYVGYDYIMTHDEIVRCAIDAEVVITNKSPLTRETLLALPNLRLVCIAATGMNNIDLDAAEELGVEVRNAIGYSTTSVAEATITSALSLIRSVSYYDRYVKSGDYSHSGRLFSFGRSIGELSGRRWGVIGMGAIGREVARLATAFRCEVRYFSTSGAQREEEYQREEQLSELLAWSDVVSIHSPLNDQTRGLIGAEEISLMQSHSILINMARGGIVDEVALCDAINSDQIASAALDVFEQEPLNIDSPLLTVRDPDRLQLSPHKAWSSGVSIERLVASIAESIMGYYKL